MSAHKYTERELKFTAVIYASRSEIVEYIRKNGKLPARVPLGGFPTAMNLFAVKWGTQVELSEEARLVYDAILKDRHLPAGGVILFPDSLPIYSVDPDQAIEVRPDPRSPDGDSIPGCSFPFQRPQAISRGCWKGDQIVVCLSQVLDRPFHEGFTGRVKRMLVPYLLPSSRVKIGLSAVTCPPCASTSCLTMAKPRPEPPLVRERDFSAR